MNQETGQDLIKKPINYGEEMNGFSDSHFHQPKTHHYNIISWNSPDITAMTTQAHLILLEHLTTAKTALAVGKINESCAALVKSSMVVKQLHIAVPIVTMIDVLRNAADILLGKKSQLYTTSLLKVHACLDQLDSQAPELSRHIRIVVRRATVATREGAHLIAASHFLGCANRLETQGTYLRLGDISEKIDEALKVLLSPTPAISRARLAINTAVVYVSLNGLFKDQDQRQKES